MKIKNIYIHIPFCLKKCSYCDFPVHALGTKQDRSHTLSLIDNYIQYLCKEINFCLSKNQTSIDDIDTIYFGGGTPSILEPH
jgi:coproporphyrinogen III oxidase-like Fe-S oxidoreductase